MLRDILLPLFLLHMIVVSCRQGRKLALSDLGKCLFVCLKIPQNFTAFDHLLIFLWKCSKHVRPGGLAGAGATGQQISRSRVLGGVNLKKFTRFARSGEGGRGRGLSGMRCLILLFSCSLPLETAGR